MPLRLSITLREYEKTQPLLRGKVPIEGVDPVFVPFEIDHFRRMLNFLEFDVCEMSMSSYLAAREKGVPIVALPIFPHRRFRHSYVFVPGDSRAREPRDLIGKRVGIPDYQMTALTWIRGFMWHDYDVKPAQLKWFFDQDIERFSINIPEDVSLQELPSRSKERLFLEGKLDALIDGKIPEMYLKGDKRIRRLFENYQEVEAEYYGRTGHFPIMHTVVVKRSILDDFPWVAMNIWKAFVAAKQLSYRRMDDPRVSNFVWPHRYNEDELKVFGGKDRWPYNLADNRRTLEALVQYQHEQGLISKVQPVDDLFAPSTLDLKESQHLPYDA